MNASSNTIPCAQDNVDPDDWHCWDKARTARAQGACGQCPIQAACLQEAMNSEVRDGVWGGTTEDERRAIFAARRTLEAARQKSRRTSRRKHTATASAA